jgi:hypothetical protein
VVGPFQRAQRLRVIIAFVDLALSTLVSLSFPCFSLGLDYVVCPSNGLRVVSCGCYINIAGRKPVSRMNIGHYELTEYRTLCILVQVGKIKYKADNHVYLQLAATKTAYHLILTR